MAAGKVCTGFSKPYVALYNASGGGISYSNGQVLARGVEVSIEPDNSNDNKFYADNVEAESAAGTFTGGTLTLTVDGLFISAERFIMGLPEAGEDGFTAYGDNASAPNMGFGCVARYMSGGITSFVPIILVKVKFNQPNVSAKTQEDQIDWQTQELTATIMRGEDTQHTWKYIGAEYATEEEAERVLQNKMGIYVVSPFMSPVPDGVTLFGTLVSDMQNGVVVSDSAITGTLKFLDSGDIASHWGDGNFLCVQFENIDTRATSVRVGLDPSESSGLVEIIDDPDKNGVFKITNKDTQKFVVVTSDGTHTVTKTYDLSGLTVQNS